MIAKFKNSCLLCGKKTNRTTTKFCSQKCSFSWRKINNIHYGGPQKKMPKICPQCNTTFIHKNDIKQKYCSRRCTGKARGDFCRNLGLSMKGRKLSQQARNKLSIAASKRNAMNTYTRGCGGYRKDLGHYVRSKWEANFCRVLKLIKINYKYEPVVFTLINGKNVIRYSPDIYILDNLFFEIKGWWDQKSLLKKKLMEEQFPNIRIIYIDEKEYKKITLRYKNFLSGWEQ